MLLVKLLLSGLNWKTFEDICPENFLNIQYFYPLPLLIFLFYFSTGTAVALAGVFLYSRVKRIKSKPKTA